MATYELLQLKRKNRELKRYLTELVLSTDIFLKNMDIIMQEPSTTERGKAIAKQCNALDLTKDRAKHFGLGIPFKGNLNVKKE